MQLDLVNYQHNAVETVLQKIETAATAFKASGQLAAISLSAPTGAGKTVIATAVIERLLYGGDGMLPDPELTVLWVTDDPNLNEQVRRKMRDSSSIPPGKLITIEKSLDQEVLDPGAVYFIHIQRLGKGAKNFVTVGDKRKISIWDTIGNTISHRGTHFLLFIDEAHRGAKRHPAAAKTITAQLIDGSNRQAAKTPLVLGISATPKRFNDAIISSGDRALTSIIVDSDEVRQSGLIKDKIRICHPTGTQSGDSTLIELAVNNLKEYDHLWEQYSSKEGAASVKPVLVVQVRPKSSDKELSHILSTLKGAWDVLGNKAIAQCFQEHTTRNLGSRTVRYIAPQDIQDDGLLRVVLFKEALSTGWDCPRAEVMVSLRQAKDHTYIAQLIGRMVRTPLARRIPTNEVLNSVSLYLPHFDAEQVAIVIAELQSEESSLATEIETNSIVCSRNDTISNDVWNSFKRIPTYTRPSKHRRNEVTRLNGLAAQLVGTGIDSKATQTARQHIVDTLVGEIRNLEPDISTQTAKLASLSYDIYSVNLATQEVEIDHNSVPLNPQNVEDLFRRSKRILGDNAAMAYWNHLCDLEGLDPHEAKLQVVAASLSQDVIAAVDSSAETRVNAWRKRHLASISELPDAKRAAFDRIWEQSTQPQLIQIILPEQTTTSDNESRFEKHLYANRGYFSTKLTGWEVDVVRRELASKTLEAWYRNPTNGPASLAVPYDEIDNPRTMYPDFIFAHRIDGKIVLDIVDPHRPDLADTVPKWIGLATYARKHKQHFRKVSAVIQNLEGSLLCLDLRTPAVMRSLEAASNESGIRAIFENHGGDY